MHAAHPRPVCFPIGRECKQAGKITIFPGIVLKLRQAQTFLDTIENEIVAMKILAMISVLALLTISGAAYTDQLLTSEQESAQGVN